jgi:selenophosphate synthetase-related protein
MAPLSEWSSTNKQKTNAAKDVGMGKKLSTLLMITEISRVNMEISMEIPQKS